MIKIETYDVVGWEHAIRGMRNPMNSHNRSDSTFYEEATTSSLEDGKVRELIVRYNALDIGPNDHDRMMKLSNGGPVHAKYRRMINVYVDITAPLYWWKEFDTYRVGVTPNPTDIEMNSCSTMHKIHEKEFTMDDFSCEHLTYSYLGEDSEINMDVDGSDMTPLDILDFIKDSLNHYRKLYIEAKTKPMKDESKRKELMKKYWWQMIQLLPSSYNQKRTVMLNYEVLAGLYPMRKNHKLDEWVDFCKWIETLPYSEIITGGELYVIDKINEIGCPNPVNSDELKRIMEDNKNG